MYNSPAMSMTKNIYVEHEFTSGNEVTGLTDNEIISLFNTENELAVSAASERYVVNCSRIAKNILKNDQDAEECVNSTYLELRENISHEQPDTLCAYTAKITRCFAIDLCGERSEKRGRETALILGELAECVSDNSGAEPAAERREILSAVNGYLETLPAEKRIAFVLRYCMCESVKSIARRLGTTRNSVSVNLFRTRKGLAAYLKGKGFEI